MRLFDPDVGFFPLTEKESESTAMTTHIASLFLDIGGVLLTNGWGRISRQHAAATFHLDQEAMDERHHLTFDTYEEGKLSLDEYLDRVIFYETRPFTRADFKAFMYAESQPYSDMLALIRALKAQHHLQVAVVSNEGRELAEFRVRKFGLADFVDFFIFSSFVHIRKPDTDIFRLALDVSQMSAGEVVYIEDRPMFVDVARSLGITGIRHTDYGSTRAELSELGLPLQGENDARAEP
jgi:putative hydrolase of the HAD superfamily